MQKKLLFVVNVDWFFVSHWLPLARAAKCTGYEVHVATNVSEKAVVMSDEGFIFHDLAIDRSGTNPLIELLSAIAIFRLMKAVKPDAVHLMTIKPVIYGGIAARLANIPAVVVSITGLGFVFISKKLKVMLLRYVVVQLYKTVFRHKNVFATFENESDKTYFLLKKIVMSKQVQVVHGAGVDLKKFSYTTEPENKTVVTFAARLLKDKGFFEFVAAARMLRSSHGNTIEFWVVGLPDPVNPSSVSQQEIDRLTAENVVTFLGFRQDMADILSRSNIVVLPSYREGLPKVLMEAAACGRAIVTTDVPGCRHVILPGTTGLLVPPGQTTALAGAIAKLAEEPTLRLQFGKRGRILAEQRFDVDKITADYLSMYHKLLSRII